MFIPFSDYLQFAATIKNTQTSPAITVIASFLIRRFAKGKNGGRIPDFGDMYFRHAQYVI